MNLAQRSFAKGEVAPALYARTDQVAYATGLRTCRNFRVLRQGGIENRPGTWHLDGTPGNSVVRLLPFVFNDEQTYVLEFSDTKLRFIRDGGYVGAPYVLTTPYLAADLSELQITQSADVVTIVHPRYESRELRRVAETNWTLTLISFAPSIAAPSNVHLHPAEAVGATFRQWVVTAIDGATGQESLPSEVVGIGSISTPQARTITWDAVPGAVAYNVYKGSSNDGTISNDLGFIGSTGKTSFFDNGLTADLLNRAPVARNPFVGADNYPAAVTHFQQRRIFGNTNNAPETVFTSRSADFANLTTSSPSQDDDAITFTLAGQKVNAVRHFVSGLLLLVFTSGGEFAVIGDGNGVLRPSDCTPLNFSKHGCASLAPIEVGDNRVLFLQSRRSIVRDVRLGQGGASVGADLTIAATHLFDGHTIVDWAYQEIPHSIVWAVRDDGVLLGLTDVAEQEILAWHRHDTLGLFENVCCIPEGSEDAVYVCVNRGGTRSVERFASRYFADVQDALFLDAALSYDGRNTDASKTITISGGTTWDFDELLTLTANVNQFAALQVGDSYVMTGLDADGAAFVVPVRISSYTSPTVVQGLPERTIPAPMRNVALSSWSRAVPRVGGLSHLEGKAVGVYADGYVVASPNNPNVVTRTVSGGIVTLDRPYSYIHVGLPFVSDMETLDIDTPSGPSLKDKKVLINQLSLIVEASRGIFAGPDAPDDDGIEGLVEWKLRETEDFGAPVALRTDTIDETIPGNWDSGGHVFVRQVDPVPLTILGAIPTGNIY